MTLPSDTPAPAFPARSTRRWLVLAGAALAGGAAFAPRIGAQVSVPPSATALPVSLQPDDVTQRLERAGFSEVSRLRRRGQVFTAEALSRNGLRARIVINSTTGEILGLRYVEPRAPASPADGS